MFRQFIVLNTLLECLVLIDNCFTDAVDYLIMCVKTKAHSTFHFTQYTAVNFALLVPLLLH